ncbi:hypothetical protein SO694_00096019 [Aureococcus anophagefferens]|uniref:Sulfotransferase domain-containing protein n=1 Tax=Aureococcus anophagefferens TaxID=44056 RepID=A0ABR1FS81_AURAN
MLQWAMLLPVALAACPPDQIVFGVGLPKSGTRSMGMALQALGFTASKGMVGTRNNGVDYKFHADLLPFVNGNTSGALANLGASKTWAGSTLYNVFPFYALPCELAARYDRALFVNVDRECGAWARSALRQLSCAWLKRGCDTPLAADEPHDHTSVGFRSTRWYFDQLAPGLVDGFCADRGAICTKASGSWNFNASAANSTAALRRLEAVCARHPARVAACVPPARYLSLTLAEDSAEFEKIVDFLGCDGADRARAGRLGQVRKQWSGTRAARQPKPARDAAADADARVDAPAPRRPSVASRRDRADAARRARDEGRRGDAARRDAPARKRDKERSRQEKKAQLGLGLGLRSAARAREEAT